MRRSLACIVVLLLAQLVGARTIDVSEHGIVPGRDVTFELNALLESVAGQKNVTLMFPKGKYDFHPDNAFEEHRAVANHDNGLKRMAFPLYGNRNITIDGGGSAFIFHGHMVPFTLEGVDGSTLKNFSIDWIRSFHAEMKCVSRDLKTNSAVFDVDPELYPYRIDNGQLLFKRFEQEDTMGSNMVWDPRTRAPIYDTRKYALAGKHVKAQPIKPGQVKLVNAFRKEPPPVGTVLVVYGVHPTSRLCPAIHIVSSNDIKIEDVTVYEAGGMGLIVERTDNIHLNRMKITSTEDRIVATRADSTHFIGCKGKLLVENCVFEHMLDDSINVHGAYVRIEEYLGNNQFLCGISHFQQWGFLFAEPGDKIALLSRETVLPFFETRVTGYKKLNEKRFVLTVAKVPDPLPGGPLSAENLTWNPDFIFRKNITRENRARSVLVTTKGKVLIEDNYFASQMHGILIEGDNKFWYESGAVEDVVIRNNTFENIGFAKDGRYPLYASPMFTPEQRMGEGQYHRNIEFTGNTIKTFNGHVAFCRSIEDLEIEDNTIEFSTDYPAAKEGPAIVLEYCNDVDIKDNKASGFDAPLTITQSDDTTDVEIKKNVGIE